MFKNITNWFKSHKRPVPNASETYNLLKDRSSAEIAARLTRRAAMFEESGDEFLKRCAALDKVAADTIAKMQADKNDPDAWRRWIADRELCVRLLAEGSK